MPLLGNGDTDICLLTFPVLSGVASFFSAIPTSDPNVETSAGARPTVGATGDADPGLMTQQQEAADEQVAEKRERKKRSSSPAA